MLGTVVEKLLELSHPETSNTTQQRRSDVHRQMKQEGLEFLEHSIRAHIHYKGYSEPGKSIASRNDTFRASLFVTKERLLVVRLSTYEHIIDMPWSAPALPSLIVKLDGRGLRIAATDVSLFHSRKAGAIDVLLDVPQPRHLRSAILSHFPKSQAKPPYPISNYAPRSSHARGHDDRKDRRRRNVAESFSERRRHGAVHSNSGKRRRRVVGSHSDRRRHSHAVHDARRRK